MSEQSSAGVMGRLHTTLPLPAKIKQIDVLQILRAVAVILVTWGHASLFQIPHPDMPTLGIYGIDVFFVISGFIMSYIVIGSPAKPGLSSAGTFYIRRLIRIFPIYWIFALIGIVRYGHSHLITARSLPSLFLVPIPAYPRIYGLSWTLMFEMYFYTAMAVVLLFTVRYAVPVLITFFCASILAGEVFATPAGFLTVALNPMLLEFAFGALIAIAFRRFGCRKRLGITAVILGSAFAIYLQKFPTGWAESMQMILSSKAVLGRSLTWGVSAALLVGGGVFWSPAIRSRLGLAFVVIGNSSYSAYLASTLVLEFTFRLLVRLVPPGAWAGWGKSAFYMTAMLVCVLAAGWLSYQFVEWPLVRYLQRILMPKPAGERVRLSA